MRENTPDPVERERLAVALQAVELTVAKTAAVAGMPSQQTPGRVRAGGHAWVPLPAWGDDNIRAVVIYQHAVRGADRVITNAIDQRLKQRDEGDDDGLASVPASEG
ncbi:hypothetical protein [Nonomuraea helvata]|uniref:Uncharacterized protein n=1 Tax=Nonomuraea helvata TaxID=37484 RepID=A0ABV5SCQ5_9ACTN